MNSEFYNIVKHPFLYKRGVKGEVRVWYMELGYNSPNERAGSRVISGILDGKETFSGWSIAQPKNVGKSNETTSYEQAIAEIAAEYKKKSDRGYFENIQNIDKVTFVKPMLAKDWANRKDKVDLSAGTVFTQPKLDGIRCIARADGLWTRTGKPITSVPHIREALQPLFIQNPDMVFDGELYNHALRDDFNKITSIVRKVSPNAEELAKAQELIQYHIYDVVDKERAFSKRVWSLTEMLQPDIGPYLFLVPTKKVVDTDTLDALYGRWLEEGYEGQIIRLDTVYENKRSNSLMKRKEFITDEFDVVGMHEGDGNWSEAVKRFTLALPSGVEFGAGVRGEYESLAKLLQDGKSPKWATVRYFGLTPDGIPRFAVVIDFGFEDKRAD